MKNTILRDTFKEDRGESTMATVTRFMEIGMDLGYLDLSTMEHICAEMMNEENANNTGGPNSLRWSIAYNLASCSVNTEE